MNDLHQIAEFILKEAQKCGADDADVFLSEKVQSNITVRLGKIEELKQANPKSLGLRIFSKKRNALTYTSDFRPASLRKLVRQTVEMAKVTEPDPMGGLPDPNLLGRADVALPQYDATIEKLDTAEKVGMVTKMEKIGMAKDPLITNSDGARWSDARTDIILANSRGFIGKQRWSSFSLNLSLVAEKKGVKQSDYWWTHSRFFDHLDSIEDVANTAAERTLRKIGAVKPQTQSVPVVFDPVVGRDLLSILAQAVLGSSIYKRRSFLLDRLDQSIAADKITIIDDGLLLYGLGSRLFDDEGLPSQKNIVIDKGVLKTYLCDCYSARKLAREPTGSASRSVSSAPGPAPSNFYLQKGDTPAHEIISSVKNGLYLTSVNWVGVNYITGDYSRGAEGLWIENGKRTYPVQEFTVAGNVLDMLQNITMVGDDLIFKASINAPTFKIDKMTVSGA